ncbi:MAG: lipopolysaccharide kinase InaA family protein, partial [Acidiferrobacterales bacterium]|nr:lipopolysaccharide kinase InaA family protein [Acidiferrobacterales bacterium]
LVGEISGVLNHTRTNGWLFASPYQRVMSRFLQKFRYERVVVHPDWQAFFQRHGSRDFSSLYDLPGETLVQASRSSARQHSVGRLSLLDGERLRTFYLKKVWFFQPTIRGFYRGTFFRSSKAKREYQFLARLRASGLDVVRPVAYGEERCARLLRRAFLLTEAVPEALSLQEFITQVLPTLRGRQARRLREEMINRLAATVRELHTHGLCHQDLYWRNIVLSRPRFARFFLLDSPKGRRWMRGEDRRCRAKDLATLDAPAPYFLRRTERLRFLLSYLGEKRLTPVSKAFARKVLRLAQPERDLQLRRVLAAKVEFPDQVAGL